MRRAGRANWRRYIEQATGPAGLPHNKGLWALSRWSRQRAGKAPTLPHLPALRRTEQDEPSDDNKTKADILAEKFFPEGQPADLSDINNDVAAHTPHTLNIPSIVTVEELLSALKSLPNGKAPGPDGIPNEVVKGVGEKIPKDLAQAISTLFAGSALPPSFRESTTVVLRKERKKDYSLLSSYRPITLENTFIKLTKKIVARRIADVVKEHSLLSWNQMGARRGRSSISAIELLRTCVQTAWRARPGCVVSMLSLDLSGAFDNVSHGRLLHIIKKAGLPPWIVQFVANFLSNRRTRIHFSGYTDDWRRVGAGIPQGSPLSPILFLFFVSELLASFQDANQGNLGFGFVDDTNLMAWGDTAEGNCRRLEQAHDRCIAWAKRHGAKFAPDKYQLIHFSRRRSAGADLASQVRIASHDIKAEPSLRVLGVQVDARLTWRDQIQTAASKGQAAFDALTRFTTSTWGPSMAKSRLVYSAVVRPTMLYGSQVWGVRDDGAAHTQSMLRPLVEVQKKCLRRVTGAYQRTPTAAVEREACVPPLTLYTDTRALQYAAGSASSEVSSRIAEAASNVWSSLRAACGRRTRSARATPPRPKSSKELLTDRASLVEAFAREAQPPPRPRRRNTRAPHPPRPQSLLSQDMNRK